MSTSSTKVSFHSPCSASMKLVVELDAQDFPAALILFNNLKDLLPQTTVKGPSLPAIIQQLAENNIADIVHELATLMVVGQEVSCEPAKVVEAIVTAHIEELVATCPEDTNEIYATLLSR